MKTPRAVRITFLGKELRQVYPHASRWQVAKYRFFRAVRWLLIRTGIAAAAFTALTGVYFYGQATAPNISAINTIVAAPIERIAPVLHRIAVAESGDRQFGRDGQVVIHANSNGTYDTGRYQVNSIWNKKATEMGFNLMDEKDNEAFAIYLFERFGSEPWSASKSAWNK